MFGASYNITRFNSLPANRAYHVCQLAYVVPSSITLPPMVHYTLKWIWSCFPLLGDCTMLWFARCLHTLIHIVVPLGCLVVHCYSVRRNSDTEKAVFVRVQVMLTITLIILHPSSIVWWHIATGEQVFVMLCCLTLRIYSLSCLDWRYCQRIGAMDALLYSTLITFLNGIYIYIYNIYIYIYIWFISPLIEVIFSTFLVSRVTSPSRCGWTRVLQFH